MRYFNIEALSGETAGQSEPGSLVSLTGTKNGRDFRDAVLKQRDIVVGSEEDRGNQTGPSASSFGDQTAIQLLQEIRDCLIRIDNKT